MIQTNKIKEVLLKVTDPELKIVSSADKALLYQAGHGIESLNPSLKFFCTWQRIARGDAQNNSAI